MRKLAAKFNVQFKEQCTCRDLLSSVMRQRQVRTRAAGHIHNQNWVSQADAACDTTQL